MQAIICIHPRSSRRNAPGSPGSRATSPHCSAPLSIRNRGASNSIRTSASSSFAPELHPNTIGQQRPVGDKTVAVSTFEVPAVLIEQGAGGGGRRGQPVTDDQEPWLFRGAGGAICHRVYPPFDPPIVGLVRRRFSGGRGRPSERVRGRPPGSRRSPVTVAPSSRGALAPPVVKSPLGLS
jgi:hypothetical protein